MLKINKNLDLLVLVDFAYFGDFGDFGVLPVKNRGQVRMLGRVGSF